MLAAIFRCWLGAKTPGKPYFVADNCLIFSVFLKIARGESGDWGAKSGERIVKSGERIVGSEERGLGSG